MKSITELLETKDTRDIEQESRDQFVKQQEDLIHKEWLREHETVKFLKELEEMRNELIKQSQNLVDNEESNHKLVMLTKETQTLTKVINYARRKDYTTV